MQQISKHQHVRRVPRGNTGHRDPITLIARDAQAGGQRIKGMLRRVKLQEDRNELKKLRIRIIEILRLILETPEHVRTGTAEELRGMMQEARGIYGNAPKSGGRSRKRRTREWLSGDEFPDYGDGGENAPDREKGKASQSSAPPRSPSDSRADLFDAEMDQMERR